MNFEEFNATPIIQKMQRSKSSEILDQIESEKPEPQIKTRGRKIKYVTEEERLTARKKQQKEYRERKKMELEQLKEKIKEYETLIKNQ